MIRQRERQDLFRRCLSDPIVAGQWLEVSWFLNRTAGRREELARLKTYVASR